jgi:hypothetical protein
MADRVIRIVTPEEIREMNRRMFDKIFEEAHRTAARLSAERRPEPQRQNPRQVDQEPGKAAEAGAGG